MKILLITPGSSYSVGSVIKEAFISRGCEVEQYDFEKELNRIEIRINTNMFRLPYKIRSRWDRFYLGKLNQILINKCRIFNPDLVFIYNDCNLLPETVKTLRCNHKIAFYLGDNPFYTWTKPLFLNLLMEADWIFAPDTQWIQQLKILGVKNIQFEVLGWDEKTYHSIDPSEEEKQRYASDLVFIGNSYVINWGYKRALFLSQFESLDLKIYGTHHWFRWLEYFPGLKNKFVPISKPISLNQVNLISNCCKIYPVDANPGILNGIHARIFDCIGSGILPLAEYRKDLDFVFNGIELPSIQNYTQGKEIAEYYLRNEDERKQLIKSLFDKVRISYTPSLACSRILEEIFS